MKKVFRDKLKSLGISSESYADVPHYDDKGNYIEDGLWPPRWGITLEGPRGNMVIDHTYRDPEAGQDGKYHLRPERGSDISLGAFKTQREAIAAYIERLYI